jgi:hypothetical protein
MRKVYIETKIRLIIQLEEGILVDDVIQEMDYNFTSMTTGADIIDTEIEDYNIVDSK